MDYAHYRPPFVTETDEPNWDDCGPCAVLMAVACWTMGEVVTHTDGSVYNKDELKRLREKMRNHLPITKQRGYTTMADAQVYVEAEWPRLPAWPLYDERGEERVWSQMIQDLSQGYVGVALGNPSNVQNPNSDFRRWTNDDHFEHFVTFVDIRGTDIYVMNPLGNGNYDGAWVPMQECKQFTDTYTSAGREIVKVCMVERGQQSMNLINHIKDVQQQLDSCFIKRTALQDSNDQLKAELAAADQQLADAQSQLAACVESGDGEHKQLDELNAQVAALTKFQQGVRAKADEIEKSTKGKPQGDIHWKRGANAMINSVRTP